MALKLAVLSLIALSGAAQLAGLARAETPAPPGLTAQEKRGKEIYTRGSSPGGREITARLGDGSVVVPATVMPCANCHGLDGAGKPEGGVIPPDLTWEALTKPYGAPSASGRERPPYTDRLLEDAITRGIDPAGNKLLAAMPRYAMSPEDLSDLMSYLKRIGKDADAGIAHTSIRVGTVLPPKGPMSEMGRAMNAVMSAYFDQVNRQGGIYNRRIDFHSVESAQTPEATAIGVKAFAEREGIFAMVGAFIAGADREITSSLEKDEVPLIGPWTLYPQTNFPLNRRVFYLLSGLAEQSLALANFAAQDVSGPDPGIAVVYSDADAGAASAIAEQCKSFGWNSVTLYKYSHARLDGATLARSLIGQNARAVFFLGKAQELKSIFQEGGDVNWTPKIYMPGSFAGKEIFELPERLSGNIFLSFPTVPQDQTEAGLEEYRALAGQYSLPSGYQASQLLAYCAAKTFVHALKLAGRDLSRERLVLALENLSEFRTGLIPPITYGPNRRVGASGSYVVVVNLQKKNFTQLGGRLESTGGPARTSR
ncbi:MAG TPA: ABC transporter substrate-binding protein [Blastocatellia bacterium]|nr:ABC transporter substrate-binding protein [Blastocatellia bacterium]